MHPQVQRAQHNTTRHSAVHDDAASSTGPSVYSGCGCLHPYAEKWADECMATAIDTLAGMSLAKRLGQCSQRCGRLDCGSLLDCAS
jgi:hypothetical protein